MRNNNGCVLYIDLEKAYAAINQHGMKQILRLYGVAVNLLKAVQSFHVDIMPCVRMGIGVSEWSRLMLK